MRGADAQTALIDWTLRTDSSVAPPSVRGRVIEASVPGCVHTDLIAAGLLADPCRGDGEDEQRWIGHCDWTFVTRLAPQPPTSHDERVDLVFDGLDTMATVAVDGRVIARTANMHRSYRFDLGPFADGRSHELSVTFAAPIEAAQQASDSMGLRPHVNTYPYNAIRKMACNYGWDWGPQLVTSGIWRPARVERWTTVRVASVRPLVRMKSPTSARIDVHVELEWAGETASTGVGPRADVAVDVAGAESSRQVDGSGTEVVVELDVSGVEQWWPRGHGGQPLYPLTVRLNGTPAWRRSIGMRTVELDQSPDSGPDGAGTSLRFVINGRPILIRGANWIPDDCFPHRVDRARYAARIEQAVAANVNLLRVWGGGIYESEDFYELCDRAGMLVWQDFLLACAGYAEEEPLRSEIVAEAREAITRLSPHPSLVLWNGGNENLWGYEDWDWQAQLAGRTWGHGYYYETFPQLLAELDPTRPYTPGSPFSPGGHRANDPARGGMHIWDVWNTRDYTAYRDYIPRFAAEFGFQGPPTWSTLTDAVDPDQRRVGSRQMLSHQKAEDGDGKLARGLIGHIAEPQGFEDWHWATSLNQARAVAFGIEHLRSYAGVCSGTIMWQLNDCWPVVSWAAVDGYGRRKPLWYALRRAYQPRLITLQPRDGRLAAVLVNDTDEQWDEELVVTRLGFDARELAVTRTPVQVEAGGTVTVPLEHSVGVADRPAGELLRVACGSASAHHFFAEDVELDLEPANIDVSVVSTADGHLVQIKAHNLVRDLALLADKVRAEAEVDHMLVTLMPGESTTFTVHGSVGIEPGALRERSVLRSANDLSAKAR